jgi:ketosteroid isomerase-like protein
MTASTTTGSSVAEIVDQFNAAWNDHDLGAALALTSEDCVFESTSPAPDGQRCVGHDEISAAWEPIFTSPHSHFSVEDSFVAGDRLVQQWRYDWGDGHIRGIDIIVVQGGLVTAKLAYVKG